MRRLPLALRDPAAMCLPTWASRTRRNFLRKPRWCSGICDIIAQRKLTQVRAAKLLGIDQPKVSALLRAGLTGFRPIASFAFSTLSAATWRSSFDQLAMAKRQTRELSRPRLVKSSFSRQFLKSPRELSISPWVCEVWRMMRAGGMGQGTIAPGGGVSLTPCARRRGAGGVFLRSGVWIPGSLRLAPCVAWAGPGRRRRRVLHPGARPSPRRPHLAPAASRLYPKSGPGHRRQ